MVDRRLLDAIRLAQELHVWHLEHPVDDWALRKARRLSVLLEEVGWDVRAAGGPGDGGSAPGR